MIKKVLLFVFIIFSVSFISILYFIQSGHIYHFPKDVIFRNEGTQLSVASCPLNDGSLIVESILDKKNLVQWSVSQHTEAYNLLQNTARLWKENDYVDNFMVIGTIPPRMHSSRFFWEIIPFTTSRFNFLDQFKVVWNLIFNSPCLSKGERQSIKQKYQDYLNYFSQAYKPTDEKNSCIPSDVFCNQQILTKQLLYEGKWMYILYNHSPLGVGHEKLHFLIIPKEHRMGFPEITLDEYLECQQMTSKLLVYYEKKNFPISYIFHKTGKYAGQTVPHWHQHVIFTPNQTYEFIGKLLVLRKMLFATQPLPDEELKELVSLYREQIQEAMKD